MGFVKQLRRTVNYDHDTPKCSNCILFRPEFYFKVGTSTRLAQPTCGLHLFNVNPGGLCDDWEGRDGTELV
jgi:hypothetical protein